MMKCPKCGYELEDDEFEDYLDLSRVYLLAKRNDEKFWKEYVFIIEHRPFDLVNIKWAIPNVSS